MIFQGYIDCNKCGRRLAVCYIDTEQMTMKIYAMENQVKIFESEENIQNSNLCPCLHNLTKFLHHLAGEEIGKL